MNHHSMADTQPVADMSGKFLAKKTAANAG
jgi:hypothetical protein